MSEETIPQMRDRIDELNKKVTELESANSGLTLENRSLKTRDAFRQAGYDPVHADLFPVSGDDVSVEAVTEFAEKYRLSPSDVEPVAEEGDPGTPTDGALNSMSGAGTGAGGGGAAPAGTKSLTREEWRELSRTDPAAAREAVKAGRVQVRSDNFYVKNAT